MLLQALDLKKEREKTDTLLSEMLPRHIVSMLKQGKEPKPQIYKYESLYMIHDRKKFLIILKSMVMNNFLG